MPHERKDHLQQGADVSPYKSLVAGSISGAVARAITAPLDTVKIRLQLQTAPLKDYLGVSHTFKNIVRNEGVIGLWKGNVPAEIMYILYGATQFTSYSILNKALTQAQDNVPILRFSRPTHSLIVGAG
ncbi:mitochondrial thiamine pyrophosphate transporter [Yamadazyma tenuis]|nr:mitochondrial thiamine pyrophosphate transporter [Yamadazyma tenuis]